MNRPDNRLARTSLAVAVSLFAFPASAYSGPYIGAQFGINKASDLDLTLEGTRTATSQPPIPVELPKLDNGGVDAGTYGFEKNVVGQVVVGYKYGFGLRPEFELSLRRERVNSIVYSDGSSPDSTKGTRLSTVSGFANLWYDAFPGWRIHPYIGGGIGIHRFILNNAQTDSLRVLLSVDDGNISSDPVSRKADDARPGYQFGGGVIFDVWKGVAVALDYRNVRTLGSAEFFAYREQPQTFLKGDYKAQSLLFSVKYFFQQPPAVVTPPPPPPPEVVPVEEPKDDDKDGVVNGVDKCPDSPPGSVVDETGCPPPPPPPPPKTCKTPGPGEKISLAGCGTGDNIVLRGVNFDTNKATLTRNAKVLLDDVAAELTAYPDIKVQVAGHTDSRGSAALNDGLSKRRAASVMSYLVGKGIAADRMSSAGFGPNEPIADNATDEGRELNRRVELKIVSGNAVAADAAPAAPEASAPAAAAPEAAAPEAAEAPAEDAAPAP